MKSRAQALRDYVVRRLLLMVPTFIGITFATFVLVQFVPGGQIDQMRMALAGAGGGGEGGAGGSGDAPSAARHPRKAAAVAARVLRLRQATARGLRWLAGSTPCGWTSAPRSATTNRS
jgi:ABC-type microcin C transport system permease subunit YejB